MARSVPRRTQPTLTYFEKRVLIRVLGANTRALGNLNLKNEELFKARRCYMEVLSQDMSMKSLMKAIVTYFPHKLAVNSTKSTSE